MMMKRKLVICHKCVKFFNEDLELLGVNIKRCRCELEKEIYDEEYYIERPIPKNCLYSLENTVMTNEKLEDM